MVARCRKDATERTRDGSTTPPTALTIAGSDSGGGAGAQADLKTFAALRVHGTCALTAVTAQNTAEVRGVVALDPAFVRQQVETVLDDFGVRSVKTGMLATAADRRAEVASLAAGGRLPQLVVDPVLVSSTGHRLMEPEGVVAYLEALLPTRWSPRRTCARRPFSATPPSRRSRRVAARVAVAERIRATGARYVVVKGGHLSESADDVVAGPDGTTVLAGTAGGHRQRPRHRLLALGGDRRAPGQGVHGAQRHRGGQGLRGPGAGRRATWRLGAGHGPLDHFGWSAPP